jgi:hypothetical protein
MTLTKAMTRGDLVTYLAHPEWNAGVIRTVEPNGTLLVDFEVNGHQYSDDFHPQELSPAQPITQTGLPATRRLSA